MLNWEHLTATTTIVNTIGIKSSIRLFLGYSKLMVVAGLVWSVVMIMNEEWVIRAIVVKWSTDSFSFAAIAIVVDVIIDTDVNATTTTNVVINSVTRLSSSTRLS